MEIEKRKKARNKTFLVFLIFVFMYSIAVLPLNGLNWIFAYLGMLGVTIFSCLYIKQGVISSYEDD